MDLTFLQLAEGRVVLTQPLVDTSVWSRKDRFHSRTPTNSWWPMERVSVSIAAVEGPELGLLKVNMACVPIASFRKDGEGSMKTDG